ncbi:MAG: resolvase [unclassified Hahellaceae]|nr:resolvase [Hahellaceae bacterium]|tara:strand:+ start:1084 stop:1818 length:735 start_codon:yes stop_codon:yes gene_type:complete
MTQRNSKPSASPRYIAYYRVSTDRQGQSGLGIEGQREKVRQFLSGAEGGYPPLYEFTETESGRKNTRPQLTKALAACRLHGATLIIAKLDRLARNASFLMELVDNSERCPRFCDFPSIPEGAAGRFMLQQMAAVAELEAGLISERTKAALKAKVARDGQWDRKASHHLVPGAGQKAALKAVSEKADKRAADIAHHIESLKESGITSLNALAKQLNEEGIATARGGQWTATAVRRVLARTASDAA